MSLAIDLVNRSIAPSKSNEEPLLVNVRAKAVASEARDACGFWLPLGLGLKLQIPTRYLTVQETRNSGDARKPFRVEPLGLDV